MTTKPIQRLFLLLTIFIVVSVAFISVAIAHDTNRMALPITTVQVADRMKQNQTLSLANATNVIVAQAPTKSPSSININPETGVPDGAILLTVFLKHDQSKTLDQILAELKQSGYWKAFPPEGVNVVSWYVVMGIGQVVTLAVPPDRLRAVNRALERTAWKAYRTEFYATYDFMPIAKRSREQANS
ncbi:hypothetical protein [Stenomitos frigidus]|uniref:Uncharacterized protein n=1 Tax=Stenomitos frigidus ULC18 TaxID=2107698 RepID=A0A2T1EHJ6_9CYAN|nr:hypothetical protein [Stenomitos frigidus]PSB32209.1 hypothetical protein C7B82_06105 [Stenomitos frigidus ULC18]